PSPLPYSSYAETSQTAVDTSRSREHHPTTDPSRKGCPLHYPPAVQYSPQITPLPLITHAIP
ncbi:hypothetical protein A2U01_0107683, partial [Trifolium medium]|nr:hypothetical protein [Trifolium medium]